MSSKTGLAPFIHTEKNVPYIYLTIIVALVPCIAYAVFYYGIKAIVLILFSAVCFTLSDYTFSLISHRLNKNDYFDLSSITSGLIFSLMLPPDTPLIVALSGVLFGSVVIKQFFGGAGCAIVNPAAGASLFVRMMFPSDMLGYSSGSGGFFDMGSLFALHSGTSAVPDYSTISFAELVSGNYPGNLGQACAAVALMGAAFIVIRGNLRLYAPCSYLLTLTVLYLIFGQAKEYPVFILSSGVVFVAFFLLGDLTTMPSRFLAGVFSGVVCAALTIVLYFHIDHQIAILAPVVAVNLMSFVIDFFAKTISRRKKTSREVDVL